MKVGVREMQLLVLKLEGPCAKECGLLEETGRDKTVESPLKPPERIVLLTIQSHKSLETLDFGTMRQ